MNVVSEIYRPDSLATLQATLDRIEGEIIDANRTRSPDTIFAPPHTTADNNPEARSAPRKRPHLPHRPSGLRHPNRIANPGPRQPRGIAIRSCAGTGA